MARHAGLILPLFSAASTSGWGIGELPDLGPLSGWLASAGFDRLMLLPIGTVPEGVTSPYSAASAMAIDPIYVALDQVEDFVRAGGTSALAPDVQADLVAARARPRVDYDRVRRVKRAALDLAFRRFFDEEWSLLTTRASHCAAYISRERWWLDDYARYQAIAESLTQPSWRAWPAPLRDRDPAALDDVRRRLSRELLRHQYGQWLADTQWQRARETARTHGVTVFGDLPFMVGADSPDVWVRPQELMFDVSLGVPPDAFSATGQDWGLPTYRWDAIAATNYAWMHQRARRMAALYGGYRVDHLVGLYRTYGRPAHGEPFFNPAHEDAQTHQGETILRLLQATGAAIIAEDLGVVPDFVRASLARLGVPGCKVMRWERAWHEPGAPFVDPASYPAVSAVLTGTHDTEPLAEWWVAAAADERSRVLALPRMPHDLTADAPWSDTLRDALVSLAYHAGSDELFLPMQDLFGWRDRINTPATITDENWTWKLPWPVDRLALEPAAAERALFAATLARESGRG